jgi:electron transport complex protein RnfB
MKGKVDAIDALLPQTQCGECGFPGCRPYAEALSKKEAPIDRCPPGGVPVLKALGKLLNQDPSPFIEEVAQKTRPPALAFIREEECIGCTKCISACPVDAIMGSAKLMHTVLSQECTGCGLCLEPCPVDCITLLPLEEPVYDKDLARKRFAAVKLKHEPKASKEENCANKQIQEEDKASKQAYILQALNRVREKKHE